MTRRLQVATRKGLFTAVRSAGGWTIEGPAFLGDNCCAVLHHPVSGALYVALDHGHFGNKLHRSIDGGATFEEIAVPEYPQRAEGEEPEVDMHGRPVPDALQFIWCLEAGHASQPGRLWCGTIPGGLFRSDDGGDSWHLVESLWNDPLRRGWFGGGMDHPGIHSVSVNPQDPNEVHVAVSCGGVWRSRDDGATWTCVGEGWRAEYLPPDQAANPAIQDVHRLARCRANPEVLWAQHHNGIFVSRDSGDTWRELTDVSPSAFGFAVAADPNDPDTAWFVPEIKDERRIPVDGRVVVTRTSDGGERFQTLAHGLPGAQAWDIVYRHALDLHADGDTLAMGSTTGSLWVSEDRGEQWQTLSEHLPPVYAVRFET